MTLCYCGADIVRKPGPGRTPTVCRACAAERRRSWDAERKRRERAYRPEVNAAACARWRAAQRQAEEARVATP